MNVTIHDVAAYVVQKHAPIELDKLHKILFYINAEFLLQQGRTLFPDNALAMPSGPVFPVLDVTVGKERWRRRFEARHGTRGRRGSRRMPSMFTLLKADDLDKAAVWVAETSQ